MSFLKIDKITKSFGKTSVLKDINIEVPQGSFLVLVGPSGCGKSTLLNILAGLEASTSGEIFLAGKKIDQLGPAERNTAMVFQSYALYPNMTVEENMGFGLKMRKMKKDEVQQKVREVSKVLKIEHLLSRKPSELSGGQRQRVAMGRAIVRQPSLFLFDEPLSNLDAKLRVDMRVEIKKLHRRLKTTIVYVTHDQVEAMTLADQIAVMNLGEIQQIGAPHEIYYHPINIFTSSFMGSPSMNYLQAEVEHQAGQTFLLVQDQEQKLRIPVTRPPKALPAYYGKKVVVGLRPESIFVSPQNPLFSKKIEVLEMAGAESYVLIQLGTTELMAKVDTALNLKVGELYPFSFNLDRLVLFCPSSEKI